MSKEEFIERILPLQADLGIAIHKDEYDEIERLSIKIGKLIQRYLAARKLPINK
jgi:hypothetical protein